MALIPSSREARFAFAQVGFFVFALWLRWPDFAWMHIDERVFVERTLGFWSADLNPHFFNYPTLQLYLSVHLLPVTVAGPKIRHA